MGRHTAGGAALHDALYKAYFVDARNIGDPELLVELAASVGLPADEARAVLAERASRTRSMPIGRNRRNTGVTGVPTFVAGGYGSSARSPTRCSNSSSSESARRAAADRAASRLLRRAAASRLRACAALFALSEIKVAARTAKRQRC